MAYAPIPMPRSARPGGNPEDFWNKLNTGLSRNSNALIGLGSGLLQGRNFSQGLAAGGQGFMQGSQIDDVDFKATEEEARRQTEINQTVQWLQQNHPDLAAMVESGMPAGEAWGQALKRMQPAPAADPFTLGPGQVRFGPDNQPIAQGPAQNPENVFNIGGSDKFAETMAGELATQQAAVMDAGRNAQTGNMLLGQLQDHLSRAPQGGQGAMVQFAGNLGIAMEGLGDLQAAQAIINEIVPKKRPPGSGPMSDADLELFKQSTARIINQPGGNAYIIQTAKAINDYTIEQARIAQEVAVGRISLEDGLAQQAAIPNPLAKFKASVGAPASGGAGTLPPGVTIRRID